MSKTNYNKNDFNKLRYPLNVFSYGKWDNVEDLKNYPIFSIKLGEIDRALLFKWIMLMYDSNSPFNDIIDIKKRAIIAADEAGFPKTKSNSKGFAGEYNDIVMFRSVHRINIGKMIIQYCRLQRDSDYTQLVVYELLKIKNNDLLLGDIEVNEMTALIKAQSTLTTEIENLTSKFFNGDTSKQTYIELIESIENESLEFSPEQIYMSESTRNKVILSAPYGRDYIPEIKYSDSDLDEIELRQLRDELSNNTEEAKNHFKVLGV